MYRLTGWKRNLIAFFLIVLFPFAIFCSKQIGPKNGKTFLWKIQSNTNTSYILGSIHFLKKEMYPINKKTENAFEKSDVLVVEANLSNDKIAEVSLLIMQRGMYAGDETLKKNISKRTYTLAEKRLKEYGMDISNFQRFKPWFLAMTITSFEIIKLGLDPNFGIDKYFLDKALNRKKILELEGAEFQINLLDSFSAEQQDKFLFYTLNENSKSKNEVEEMVKAWSEGDAFEMEKILYESIQKFPGLRYIYKKLIDDRNEKMVEKIESFLKRGKKFFIVIGAGHLVGKKGIIHLLRNRGVNLTQL